MAHNHPLSDRVALVTGASRGLGRAIAAVLAQAGAAGAGLDVVPGEAPPGWMAIEADVRDPAALERAVAAVTARFGRLDVVVANAGVVPPWRETEALDFEEWDRVFAINARGVATTIAASVPALRRAGTASVIAMASVNGRRGHPRQCLYTATKHAVVGIVRATALDLGRYGIRVNGIAPGPVATGALLQRMRERAGGAAGAAMAQAAAETALGRVASEQEVASLALYLAGDGSAGITGQILAVDAGLF
jgi:NAD(P)-dependent dehydrogenase (short-subunit alcohol dehydrogenase family)